MDPLVAMNNQFSRNEDYPFEAEYYIKNFLSNSLGSEVINNTSIGHYRNNVIVDKKTEYKTNNFGYRGEDWEGPAKILAVGCSNTYGIGVPVEGSWPKILEDMLGEKIRNLSKAGASIQHLVFQIFAYFKEFGNPETILCLFPDPFRIELPVNKNLISLYPANSTRAYNDVHLDKERNRKNSDRLRYSKRPHNYDDIVPLEVPLFFSMKAIHMLEQYCKSNNVKLIWSSWLSETRLIFDNIDNFPFNNFYSNKEFDLSEKINIQCHNNYKDIPQRYFDGGCDIEDDPALAHPGVHRNIHIAEAFYKEINK